MQLESVIFQTSSYAMDNLRDTIHTNERLNVLTNRVQLYIKQFFFSQTLHQMLSFEKNL
jgi:hypothetical protein